MGHPGKTWAPEVTQFGPDSFVMYTTTTNFEPTLQCIAAATADSPEGPFEVAGDAMLVCPKDEGGAIDASTFTDDDGTRYLLWKNDGNCCGLDTWLYGQPLSDDGLSLTGEPTRLLVQDAEWEGSVIEAPFMWRHDDQLYLFYSGNAFDSAAYAVGYATCDRPLGPCAKAPENPILSSSAVAEGPGHNSVVESDGRTWIVYHAWPPDFFASSDERTMWVSELTWEDGRPVVDGPR